MDRGQAPADEQVVVRLAGGRFGLPMPDVAEVGRPPALTRVPGLPEWVAGVANWRGRVLAVLDVRPLLGGAIEPLPRRGRLVVLAHDSVQVGLLVEDVTGTAPLAVQSLEPPLASLSVATARLLCGQLVDDDGLVGVVDVAALVSLADDLPRVQRTA